MSAVKEERQNRYAGFYVILFIQFFLSSVGVSLSGDPYASRPALESIISEQNARTYITPLIIKTSLYLRLFILSGNPDKCPCFAASVYARISLTYVRRLLVPP